MTLDEIRALIESHAYDFLRTNPHLQQIAFLTLGGSHAYGTNIETSDVDIRGCALNAPSDIIGMSNFEQVVDKATDTTIYAFNKLIHLLSNCNPNVIEILGCKPEHYFYKTDVGQAMIDHRKLFLSQRAAYTFGGYAFSQLRRLENAIARDKLPQAQKEGHILNSIDKVARNFNSESRAKPVSYLLTLGEAVHDDLEKETFITATLNEYPVRDLKAFVNDINNVINDYQNDLHGRNKKKDDLSLNKHAMHLIRLYLMCIDILEKEEIITYREKEHELLMSIRRGDFQREDGTFDDAFFDLVHALSNRMEYAKNNTSLPRHPNMKRIEEFVMAVNRSVVDGNQPVQFIASALQ